MMQQSSRRWAVTTGAMAVLAAGLGFTGYAVARSASGSPGTPAAATSNESSSGKSPSTGSKPGAIPPWHKLRHLGGMRPFAGGGAAGTVRSIGAGSLTIETQKGSSLTITTTAKTLYYEAFSKVSGSALHVGENVVVDFALPAAPSQGSTSAASQASSKPTADRVEIVVPFLGGTVLSDSGGTIVIADEQGFHRTIVTSASTRYLEMGTGVSASSVGDGTDIVAAGTIASDHTDLDATAVEIVGPNVAGRVTKVSGSTITISPLQGGAAETVTTSSTTVFRTTGGASSLGALKRGDLLVAIGLRTGSTSFSASAVGFGVRPKAPARTGSGFRGGPRFGSRGVPGLAGLPFSMGFPMAFSMGFPMGDGIGGTWSGAGPGTFVRPG